MTDYSSPYKKDGVRPGRTKAKKKTAKHFPLPGPKDMARNRKKGRKGKLEYYGW